nr:hypothetical protein [Niallia taxi]
MYVFTNNVIVKKKELLVMKMACGIFRFAEEIIACRCKNECMGVLRGKMAEILVNGVAEK